MQHRDLIGTPIDIQNLTKNDFTADVLFIGGRLKIVIKPPNDWSLEVRKESEIIVPTVEVTDWKGETYGA